MSPEDAINILDQVASQVSLNRESHGQLQEAVRVIRELVEAISAPAAKEKE